jgi:hypothetical protein
LERRENPVHGMRRIFQNCYSSAARRETISQLFIRLSASLRVPRNPFRAVGKPLQKGARASRSNRDPGKKWRISGAVIDLLPRPELATSRNAKRARSPQRIARSRRNWNSARPTCRAPQSSCASRGVRDARADASANARACVRASSRSAPIDFASANRVRAHIELDSRSCFPPNTSCCFAQTVQCC